MTVRTPTRSAKMFCQRGFAMETHLGIINRKDADRSSTSNPQSLCGRPAKIYLVPAADFRSLFSVHQYVVNCCLKSVFSCGLHFRMRLFRCIQQHAGNHSLASYSWPVSTGRNAHKLTWNRFSATISAWYLTLAAVSATFADW